MKITLNEKLSKLSAKFHKGELSLTDYRFKRRQEIEALNKGDDGVTKRASHLSKAIVLRIVIGTTFAISLLLVTVMTAKYLI